MLKFQVFEDEQPAKAYSVRNAYLLGADHNAMRGNISFDGKHSMLFCDKKETGTASLALQQTVGDCGELTLQTCLLPERDEAYSLLLELARHRMMMLYNKLEEWGMFDMIADTPVQKRVEIARKLFVEALCLQHDQPAKSAKLARDALIAAIDGSEELALAHADLLLNRRKISGSLPRHTFGCGMNMQQTNEKLRGAMATNFDFLMLDIPWKTLAPQETTYHWEVLDSWVEWTGRLNIPVCAGPLISFEPSQLPEWMFIWEHDYDTARNMIYEHVERVVTRYKGRISVWNLASGLHVNSHFTLSFDQLMDLTRMTSTLIKKIQPNAKLLIELCQPFGEYFSANQRSIPPIMYADLLIQSAIPFDGFILQFLMGQPLPGQHVRDLMQMSSLLEAFSPFDKPISAVFGVPSDLVTQEMVATDHGKEIQDANCGYWRKPWNHVVQSHWMEAIYKIALSKPFVESVTWHHIIDSPNMDLPMSGLVSEDMVPKDSFRSLSVFRKNLLSL